ncbi:MAG: NFYB/HAP3 family transcription factor subunit [Candidatus Aenigmarchaeota archaeon]|nr:NFYB/HAP3 family transcription factor subunit [Candidatus Aenigmarchaeota archaeon]
MEIPLACAEKILKRTNMRVSKDAISEFSALLEETATDIASEAVAIAKSKGRATVKLEDISRAKRKLL